MSRDDDIIDLDKARAARKQCRSPDDIASAGGRLYLDGDRIVYDPGDEHDFVMWFTSSSARRIAGALMRAARKLDRRTRRT